MKAHARATDPETSKAAAASVTDLRESHQRIMTLLSDWGAMTDPTMWLRYNEWAHRRYGWPPISPSGLRSRRSELVTLGLVEDSGRTEPTASGRRQIVWQLVVEPTLW